MMMCHTNCGIIVFQGCNSMQKIFENIGNVGTGMQIFMIFMSRGRFLCVSCFFCKLIYDFYLSKTTVQNCNLSGRGHALFLGALIFNKL